MKLSHALSGLVAILLAAACSTTGANPIAQPSAHDPATIADTRTQLREFGAKYEYDIGYLEQLLGLSPAAYDASAAGPLVRDFGPKPALSIFQVPAGYTCRFFWQFFLKIAGGKLAMSRKV